MNTPPKVVLPMRPDDGKPKPTVIGNVKFWSVGDAANLLGMDRRTLTEIVGAKGLELVEVGNTKLVSEHQTAEIRREFDRRKSLEVASAGGVPVRAANPGANWSMLLVETRAIVKVLEIQTAVITQTSRDSSASALAIFAGINDRLDKQTAILAQIASTLKEMSDAWKK